jgi:hypothetical protein
MDTKLICENKYHYYLPNSTIGLPISIKNLPEEIKIQGNTFYFPTAFHVSLIYIGKIIKKYNVLIQNFEDKVVEDFCKFSKENDIRVLEYGDFKFVERDGKKTIVVMCKVSNLDNFFDLINKKYGLNIKYPTTHVTLYNVKKGESGVYLMDEDDIKNFTKHIPNPIGHPLEF